MRLPLRSHAVVNSQGQRFESQAKTKDLITKAKAKNMPYCAQEYGLENSQYLDHDDNVQWFNVHLKA